MKVVKICFLVLWMALIFSFSNQKDVDSSKVSDGFIDRTVVKIYKIFNDLNIFFSYTISIYIIRRKNEL